MRANQPRITKNRHSSPKSQNSAVFFSPAFKRSLQKPFISFTGRTTIPVTSLIYIWTVSTPSTELSFATSTQARSLLR